MAMIVYMPTGIPLLQPLGCHTVGLWRKILLQISIVCHIYCCASSLQAIFWVSEPARKAMLVRWTEAFSHALLVHVRADASLREQLQGVLLPEEVDAVEAVGPCGAPTFILQVRRDTHIRSFF
jgi:hypothetical protein